MFEAEVKRKIRILQAGNNRLLHWQLQDSAWNVVNVVTGREWSPLILTTHSGRGCIIIMLHFMLFTPVHRSSAPIDWKKPSFEANGSRSSAQNVGTLMLWLDCRGLLRDCENRLWNRWIVYSISLKTTFPPRYPAPRLSAASVAVVSSWSSSEHVIVRRGEAGPW